MTATLKEVITDVQRDGRQRTARCPAHEDARASLSVGLGDEGRVLLRCHAGCEYPSILAAAGLEARDLAPARQDERRRVIRYEIRAVDNTLVAIHERIDDPAGKKFVWRQPDGSAGLGGVKARDLPLYGAHRLKDWPDAIVVVCEGEKAAEALARRGVPAVATVTGASGLPSDEVLRVLVGRRVVLWPDADTPGRAHMTRIAARLAAIGIADIRTIDWPDAREGDDAADDHGDVATRVTAARPIATATTTASPELTLTAIGDFLAEPDEHVDWLIDGLIPAGGVVVTAGKPKSGKTTMTRVQALAVARGTSFLGRPCEKGLVWYLALEGRRRDMRDHFRRLGARSTDLLRVFSGQAPADIVAKLDALAQKERPALIVIDTMQRFLRAESTDDYAEMTTLFDAIIGIAQRSGAAINLLHHAVKADRASIDAVLGSTAITGSADVIIMLTRTDRYRTISTVQRTGDDLPETVILLDEETGAVRLGGSRRDAERDAMADELLETLADSPNPLTREDWLALVEGRRQTKLDAFRLLTDAPGTGNRKVSPTGPGTRNNPRRYCVARADSGSPVPSIEGEPESRLIDFDFYPKETHNYSGSQIPIQTIPVPDTTEPESDEVCNGEF